jgi:hypothetical protein
MDDFTHLAKTEHMFKWLSDEPYADIRTSVENILKKQVADSTLKKFQVLSEPDWLTGTQSPDQDSGQALLVRCAVAIEFTLEVETQGQTHQLEGIYTWAAVHLDQPGKHQHRVWLDINGTLDTFGSEGALKERVYFE